MAPPKRHILNCLVQNEPGVLSRVSGILAARGFNIDSLVVCSTEVADLSRMTIVLTGQDGVVEQARRQLEDLVPVWAVLDYTSAALVQRELLLAKINILGPEYFQELWAHHREITAEVEESGPSSATENEDGTVTERIPTLSETAEDFHPSRLAPSEALRLKHEHLRSITYFTHQFGGKVLDISNSSCIVEVYVSWPQHASCHPLLFTDMMSQFRQTHPNRLFLEAHLTFRYPRICPHWVNGSASVTTLRTTG